jgi:hypothetical protein
MDLFKKAKGFAKDVRNVAQSQYQQLQPQQDSRQPQYQPPQQYTPTQQYAPAQQQPIQHQHYEQPLQQQYQSTGQHYQQPVQHYQQPVQHYQQPVQHYQQPVQHYQQYAPPSQQYPQTVQSNPQPVPPANNHHQPQPQVAPIQQQERGLGPAPTVSVCLAKESSLCDAVQFYIIHSDVLTHLKAEDIHYDGIAVCSACFSMNIAPHANLAAAFTTRPRREQETPPSGFPAIDFDEIVCSFSLPRVRTIWYAECLPQGSLQPLVQYYRHVMTMPVCAGAGVSSSTYYWADRGGIMDDVGICDACHEKYLARSALDPHFHRLQWPTQGQSFICDIGMRTFFFRVLTAELDSPAPDFTRLISRMQPRTAAAPCPGENIALGQVFVHGANGDGSGIFCSECYYENIAATVLEKDFTEHWQLTPDQSDYTCEMAGRFSKTAMGIAIKRGSDEIWRRPITLKANNQVSVCVGVGGVDEEQLVSQQLVVPWYRMRQFPTIEVCPMCYIMTSELFGAARHFEPIDRQLRPGVVRQCFLSHAANVPASNTDRAVLPNSLVWRGHLLRRALSHGLIMRDGEFGAFVATAARISQMPPPCAMDARALKPINGRRYLGRRAEAEVADDKTIAWCAECHGVIMERAQGTLLEQELTGRIVELTADANSFAEGFVCNMHAKSSKDALAEACAAGNWLQFTRWYVQEEVTHEANKNRQAQMSQAAALIQMQQAASTQAASIHLMQSLNHNMNMTIMRI